MYNYETLDPADTCLFLKFAHIGGEVSSLKDQVRVLQNDSKEFENVTQKYREQLIKVKVTVFSYYDLISFLSCTFWQMSDMANNDLEKYAKALDKYVNLLPCT